MGESFDIISVGESLIELSGDQKIRNTECLHKYYGGDVLVTSVTAARLGAKVGFITKVGNDAFKDFLMDSWASEGLDISNVKISEEPNGLYIITRPSLHEKEFIYYRKKIAPTKLSVEDISEDYVKQARAVYATGISQSLSLSAKEAVSKLYKTAKENGGMTAYDPNYSAQIMSPEETRENFYAVIENIDILFLSTKYDTKNLFENSSPENIIKQIWDLGVKIVVLKSSDHGGYYTGYNGEITFTEFYTRDVIDTTCSGDAFNGAFIYGTLNGCSPKEASKLACITAGLQAKGIGAVKSVPNRDDVFAIFKQGVE